MRTAPSGIPPVVAIDRKSRQPMYKQLYEGYREASRGGEALSSAQAAVDNRLAVALVELFVHRLAGFPVDRDDGRDSGRGGPHGGTLLVILVRWQEGTRADRIVVI